MDPGLVRRLAAAALAAGLAAAGGGSTQTSDETLGNSSPPAAQAPPSAAGTPIPPAPPTAAPVVPPMSPPPSTSNATPEEPPAPTNAAPAPPPPPPETPLIPPGPPQPLRAPTAVLQVLDKVTAETLRFEAPVGRPIRYKTLVMTVKVCETRGPDDPQPRPSAYLVIDSRPSIVPGHVSAAPKRVYTGWMFANGPGLHPLQHPIYDIWLIACSAAPPPA